MDLGRGSRICLTTSVILTLLLGAPGITFVAPPRCPISFLSLSLSPVDCFGLRFICSVMELWALLSVTFGI